MGYNVFVTDEAHADSVDAFLYYDDIIDGLGNRFLSALSHVYNMLSSNPYSYSILNDDKDRVFRDVLVKGFPYVVIYEVAGDEVWVYAIHNTYQDLHLPE